MNPLTLLPVPGFTKFTIILDFLDFYEFLCLFITLEERDF